MFLISSVGMFYSMNPVERNDDMGANVILTEIATFCNLQFNIFHVIYTWRNQKFTIKEKVRETKVDCCKCIYTS